MTARASVSQQIDRGLAHHRNGDLAAAARCYRAVLRDSPDHPAALQLLGLVEKAGGDVEAAERLMRRSLAIDPDQPHVWGNLARLFKSQERLADAVRCREEVRQRAAADRAWESDLEIALLEARRGALDAALTAFERYFFACPKPSFANLNDLCNLYSLAGTPEKMEAALDRYFGDRRPAGPRRDIAFFVSLPKSAGTSIAQSVAAAAGRPHAALGLDIPGETAYSAGMLCAPLLDRLGGRRAVVQTHALPSAETLEIIRRFGDPHLFVHLRDPRDALVSYYHMAEQMDLHRFRMMLADPGYADLDEAGKLRWMKERVYPVFVRWIVEWVTLADRWDGKPFVGSFEGFVADKEGYVARCATHLDGAARPVSEVRQTHMRQGRTGSAGEVFTPEEMAEMRAAIPQELLERFGWG